jgi:hypothetical protein
VFTCCRKCWGLGLEVLQCSFEVFRLGLEVFKFSRELSIEGLKCSLAVLKLGFEVLKFSREVFNCSRDVVTSSLELFQVRLSDVHTSL